MSRNLSSVAVQALLLPQTDQIFLVILEIDHDDFGSPIRVVNNTEAITSNGNVYSPLAFHFSPPVEEDGTIRNSSIVLDAVDRSVIIALRAIDSPAPTVSASIIRAAAPDTIEAGPWDFSLRSVSYDAQRVSGELVPDNPLRRIASAVRYTNILFPGLYG